MHTSFLQRVAQTFWREKHEQVSKLTFVFPNRRAGLFFRKYLVEEAQKPLFAPAVLTINQLFQQLSTCQLADNLDLLFRLYKVYVAERKQVETFDDFLFWGRMMLSDFNEIDQHLVDASQLFSNLRDLKELEQHFSHLTEEQADSVNAFVKSMQAGDANAYREKFLTIWNSLLPIYTRFRAELQQDGLAYMGMLQREVITSSVAQQVSDTQYVFIGFNALTGVEECLMQVLRDSGQADFYWDYEADWLRDSQNRASLFWKHNVEAFPSRYTIPSVALSVPTIHWVRVASSVGQAEVVHKLLEDNMGDASRVNWSQVGIVLPNEHILSPILNAIPQDIDTINVTMGQPLHHTAVYALVVQLSELAVLSTSQDSADAASGVDWLYYKPVMRLLHHPYVQAMAGDETSDLQTKIQKNNWVYIDSAQLQIYAFLKQVLVVAKTPQAVLEHLRKLVNLFGSDANLETLDKEYLYQLLLILNRLEDLLTQHRDIMLSVKTLYQMLLQLLDGTSIPFEGEPLQGLQIMGVLESRSMDFQTLIMTDVNEETLPGKTMQNTYIPYDLRLYFKLPTAERQDAIFAYNFYRLLSHAQDVWLLQNTLSNDMTSGEVSRYVYQLQYQYHVPLHAIDVNYIPSSPDVHLPSVEKRDEVLDEVRKMMAERGLSPSTLNTYVACPLRFYWETVKGLREADNVKEDIEANQFGTVLHKVMEMLYQQDKMPYIVGMKDVERLLDTVQLTPIVEKAYTQEFYHTDDLSHLTGRDKLAIFAIKKYVEKVLEHDKTLCPFEYIASEQFLETYVMTSHGEKVRVKGVLDRIDKVGGNVRVVDYKSGAEHSKTTSMQELFTQDKGADYNHYRQTLFYALLYRANYGGDCGATIYYTSKQPSSLQKELFLSFAAITDFDAGLQTVLDEIFNPAIPFEARPETKRCEYCPFAAMCGQ